MTPEPPPTVLANLAAVRQAKQAEQVQLAATAPDGRGAEPIRPLKLPGRGDDGGRTITTRGEALAWARARLQAPDLVAVVKHGKGEADYSLTFADAVPTSVRVGHDLRRSIEVCRRLDTIDRCPPDRKQWDAVATVLRTLADVEDHDDDADEMKDWVAMYAGERGHDTRQGAAPSGAPFTEDGRLFVNVTGLLSYVRRSHGAHIDRREINRRLDTLGYERKSVSYRRDDDDTPRKTRYWRSPPGGYDTKPWNER